MPHPHQPAPAFARQHQHHHPPASLPDGHALAASPNAPSLR